MTINELRNIIKYLPDDMVIKYMDSDTKSVKMIDGFTIVDGCFQLRTNLSNILYIINMQMDYRVIRLGHTYDILQPLPRS